MRFIGFKPTDKGSMLIALKGLQSYLKIITDICQHAGKTFAFTTKIGDVRH